MSQRYKPFNRDQAFLLPPSLHDWLPSGDLAYFICEVVDGLNLGGIHQYYRVADDKDSKQRRRKAATGQPPFHPKMMVALLLYAPLQRHAEPASHWQAVRAGRGLSDSFG